MATLREQCPWDKKQTHLSLRKYLIEEAYEVLDVLDGFESLADERRDGGVADDKQLSELYTQLEEELGDLWFQVLFHAKLAEESGRFSIDDVAGTLRQKMVARHPHVFDDGASLIDGPSVETWEKIKQEEKQRTSIFDDIPAALPALLRAEKVIKRARRGGVPATYLGAEEISPNIEDDPEHGVGNALLTLVVEAVDAGVNPELALRSAVDEMVVRGRAAEASSGP